MTASTIQLLGAEKALFRHIKTGAKAPKHGLILQHQILQRSKPKFRGKIARQLSDKIAIAAKIDYFKGVIGFILIALFLLSFPDQIGAWRESIGERVTFLIIGFYIIFQNPFGVANRENELTNAIYALE